MSKGGNIKVVVRCRPLNSREIAKASECIIHMDGNMTTITKPDGPDGSGGGATKAFSFDHSYWSFDKNDPNYAGQQRLYEDLGVELLNHSFNGYNTCIVAYGQTGSGKSYSMMGYGEDRGIIPLSCHELFKRIENNKDPTLSYRVEVSYMEIYCERVRDLLNPKNKGHLKVREHPSLGPYVEDLSKLMVTSFQDIENLMDEGNKARTVAATNMNETSSRSHAVFTVLLTQKRFDIETKLETEKVSRICLVDLAGSERANSTGATGARLKEGANINKSLTTLGKVISALADASTAPVAKKGSKKAAETFVPYRDSVLTWLLKDCLGGNSKTTMIAALSPADVNYDETLSTLRYADQAKRIKNKAVVNEDPNAKLIRELKEELLDLRSKLGVYDPLEAGSNTKASDTVVIVDLHGNSRTLTKEQLQDEVHASEKIMAELNETWEEKLRKTQEIQQERERTLEELGISVEKGHIGLHTPKKMPHLVNLNEDPLMSECLVYQLKPGKTQVGRLESSIAADIRLSGSNIHDEHCYFDNTNSTVTLYPGKSSMTMVNGLRISKPKRLRSGFRVILGDYHVFRFNHPEEVRRERDQQIKGSPTTKLLTSADAKTQPQQRTQSNSMEDDRPEDRPDSPISSASVISEFVDWNYARKEAVIHAHMMSEANINQLKDQDLDVLFDNIAKIRYLRKNVRSESRGGSVLDDDTESRSSRLSLMDRWHGESPLTGEEDDRESPIPPLESSALALKEKLRIAEEEVQQMNQQRQEYEAKIESLSAAETKSDELLAEKALMEERLQQAQEDLAAKLEEQREKYEEKMKRMSLMSLASRSLDESKLKGDLLPLYSDFELDLIYKTLGRWKQHRKIQMAETILTNAVMIKEANIISRELSKQVVYQFTIIESGPLANPSSALESTSGLSEFHSDEDTELYTLKRPCVGVKVIDNKHNSIYIWSLDKLKVRLHKMRNLYNFVDRPQYRKHFNMEDPFYESPAPRYTFIGSASTMLQSLLHNKFKESVVPIICRTTGQTMGRARIALTPLSHNGARSPAAHAMSPTSPFSRTNGHSLTGRLGGQQSPPQGSSSEPRVPEDEDEEVKEGDQLLFEISLVAVEGLSEQQYTQVHAQFRLSNLTGASLIKPNGSPLAPTPGDKVFATDAVSGFEDEPIFFGFSQTLSMMVTEPILDVLRHGSLHFEFFGEAKTTTLASWEKWDRDQEDLHQGPVAPVQAAVTNGNGTVGRSRGPFAGNSAGNLGERMSEDELMMEEHHDVLAHVQVCELAPSGEYVPVQVFSNSTIDSGSFQLRQGLQRRIVLALSHTSGRQFPWHRVSKIQVGRVRLLDNKGRITESQPREDVTLSLVPGQKVEYPTDGTSLLSVQASWDSTLHESLFLNRVTGANMRVLLTLTWFVEAERCMDPVCFRMDIAAQIQDREARTSVPAHSPYRLMSSLSFLAGGGSSKVVKKKASGLFLLSLRPIVAKKASELWRMNTATKYVRGEEFLAGVWRPRGVSLVNGFRATREEIQKRENVERTRQWLQLEEKRRGVLPWDSASMSTVSSSGVTNSSSTATTAHTQESERSGSESSAQEPGALDDKSRKLLQKAIDLWRYKPISLDEVVISQDPPSLDTDNPEVIKQPRPSPRLQSEVKLITKSDNISKKGYLFYPENRDETWVKRWFVIRRPYMYIYAQSNEADELGVVNLTHVRVDHQKDLENMLNRQHVFAIYTTSNAYLMQAPTRDEMCSWLNHLDQFFDLSQIPPS
ncbi:kinesin-domain-containing protein [Linnemannia elongata AG-77]|uniref:Kinesin-domain-containing protein n=1 Tax=Linnemannia elongata AG-77 TaxID=1314771 RepID=A0A197K457_9FUNG|nr:kinesin-domain-containing protein [Linnemannia elongata AG-77]